MPVTRTRGIPAPTVAHEGNPRQASLTVAGTLDGNAFISFLPPDVITAETPPPSTSAPANGDCPECSNSNFNLSIVCCSIQGGASCELTCDTPVLVKACGGTPPYVIETDEDFLHCSQFTDDEAVITIRKKWVQFTWLEKEVDQGTCDGSTHYYMLSVKQVNIPYGCDIATENLSATDTFGTPSTLLWDSPTWSGKICGAGFYAGDTNLTCPRTAYRAIQVLDANSSNTGTLHNALGLNYPIIVTGQAIAEHTVLSGTFADILQGNSIDVTVTDSTNATASLTFSF